MNFKKSTFIVMSCVFSLAVLAKAVVDVNFYSDDFMNDQEIQFVKRLDDDERNIASIRPMQFDADFECSDQTVIIVEGAQWEITSLYDRFTDATSDNGVVAFEMGCDDKGLAQIKVVGDSDSEFYNVVNYNDQTQTLKLARMLTGGHELLTAKRLAESAEVVDASEVEIQKPQADESDIHDEVGRKRTLPAGVNILKLGKFNASSVELKGTKLANAISELYITNNEETLEFEFEMTSNKGTFSIEATVGPSGLFTGDMVSDDDIHSDIHGRLVSDGADTKARIRFYDGPIDNTVVLFEHKTISKTLYYAGEEADADEHVEADSQRRNSGNETNATDDNYDTEVTSSGFAFTNTKIVASL
ncbi:MAG: hypothetical protein ISR65_07115 [Bacteriovoracaceae bacterium]|nr:hypothetical protein [Bacteriovoracaceae bacterium]